MQRYEKRRNPCALFIKLTLIAAAVGLAALYGRFGSAQGVFLAVRGLFSPGVENTEVYESAPIAADGIADGIAESAALIAPRETATEYIPEIRNETVFTPDLAALPALELELTPGGAEPQVLIVHTHTSEAYTPDSEYYYIQDDVDRTLNPRFNVIAVGEAVRARLESAGIAVIHDETINDYPSYNDSYKRMLKIVEEYLAQYPSIRIVLDIHRDAFIYDDGSRFKASAEIGGESAAQVMLVVGTDQDGLAHEEWERNFILALALQKEADALYPGLMRPVNLRSSRFNQHVSPGALIVEVGGSGNTLGEALRGAEFFADVLIAALTGDER